MDLWDWERLDTIKANDSLCLDFKTSRLSARWKANQAVYNSDSLHVMKFREEFVRNTNILTHTNACTVRCNTKTKDVF